MEQIDVLKNGNKIIQDSERFMFGIDAVLLADFVRDCINQKDSIIDLGTGNGIIPLLLSSCCENKFTGLEIQKESFLMAEKSVEINNLTDKIKIVNGDIKKVDELFPKHSFEVVTCNPPYTVVEHGKQNPADSKAIARHEILCNLEDVVSAADFLLRPHGRFFMIHRPYRLPEIFSSLNKHQLEPKRMKLICPFENEEPNLVLIEARKNAKPQLKIEPQLSVYEKPGEYSKKVQEIYARQSN